MESLFNARNASDAYAQLHAYVRVHKAEHQWYLIMQHDRNYWSVYFVRTDPIIYREGVKRKGEAHKVSIFVCTDFMGRLNVTTIQTYNISTQQALNTLNIKFKNNGNKLLP